MITLESYKTYLVNYYRLKSDDTIDLRNKRREELDIRYGDALLTKIVNDTNDFVYEILNSDEINKGYINIKLDEDTTSFITLMIKLGGIQDETYTLPDGKIISRYILRQTFGKSLTISISEGTYQEEDVIGDDISIMYFEHTYFLSIQGFTNIDEIKNNLCGKKKILKR